MSVLLRALTFTDKERQIALRRAANLVVKRNDRLSSQSTSSSNKQSRQIGVPSAIGLLLEQAALPKQPSILIAGSVVSGICTAFLFSNVLSPYFIPIFFLCGITLPFAWVDGRARSRAEVFAEDYPTVLLATASSIKAGMTPYLALERSVRLLPANSLVRTEVERLISALRRGITKELAVKEFAADIRQSDLDLFRSAFLLVLENGGRFAPTLERLAMVSKDRSTLISSARVTTTTMRMTANVLVAVAPFLLFVVAGRTPDFWNLFLNHPMANTVASAGIVIITVSYAVLHRMSNFKP